MAKSVVRELVTLWGFDIDQKPLRELDAGINSIKSSLKQIGVVTAAAAGAVGFLLKEAGEDEQTRIAFETMLGSAELAEKKLSELKDFAAKTPFELRGLKDLSKRLLAFNFSADELIPTMRALGDISSGVGRDKLPNLVLALGQVRAATRLTGMELRQFTEAGVPLLGELAKQTGKSEAELKDMISRGEVSFDMVRKAMFAMTEEGGRFHNLMAKQSKTLLGLWSNFWDYVNIMSIEVGNEFLPLAKEILGSIMDWAEANKEIIKQDLKAFVQNLVVLLKDMWGLINGIITSVRGLTGLFGGFNNVLGWTIKLFSIWMGMKLLTGIGLLTQGLFGLVKGFRTMGNAALIANAKAALIPLTIGAIVTAIALIAEDIIAFSQGRDSVFGLMLDGLSTIFDKMKEKFSAFSDIGKMIVAFLLTPVRTVINGFKSLMTIIDMFRGKTGFMDGLKEIGGNVANSFGFGATDGLNGALGLANNAIGAADQVNSGNTPIRGLGAAPFTKNENNKKVSVRSENKFEFNVAGMDPKAAEEMIFNTFNERMNYVMREAVREGESQVER